MGSPNVVLIQQVPRQSILIFRKKIFLSPLEVQSETTFPTSKSRHLALQHLDPRALRLLAQNGSTLSPEEAIAFMFRALMSFYIHRKHFASISFIVMLSTETSVNESDGSRKNQIYPLRTERPMMLFGTSCSI